MKTTAAIKVMLATAGKTQTQLAHDVGRSPNSIHNMFSMDTDVKVGTLAGFCEALGFKLYVESEDGVRVEITQG